MFLESDGAVILTTFGQTLTSQREIQEREHRPSFQQMVNAPELLNRPSELMQVAIYPDPDRFYIPGSENADLETQEALAREDGEQQRKRLGLDCIDVIVPKRAATLSGIFFATRKLSGELMFGRKYGCHYGRTSDSIGNGSKTAIVGDVDPASGIVISSWPHNQGSDDIRAVRLIVPTHGVLRIGDSFISH
jgi:hypothetical protein